MMTATQAMREVGVRSGRTMARATTARCTTNTSIEKSQPNGLCCQITNGATSGLLHASQVVRA